MFGSWIVLGLLTFAGYEIYKSVTSKPTNALTDGGGTEDLTSPYASLSIENLLDVTFAEPEIEARLVGATKMPTSMLREMALDAWYNGPTSARAELAIEADAIARNVDMVIDPPATSAGDSTVSYKASKSMPLSNKSIALLIEVADRYGSRAVSGTASSAEAAKVEAAIKEHFRAIDEAHVKGSSVVGPAGKGVSFDGADAGGGGGGGAVPAYVQPLENVLSAPEVKAKFSSAEIATAREQARAAWSPSGTREDRVLLSTVYYGEARGVEVHPDGTSTAMKTKPSWSPRVISDLNKLSDLFIARANELEPESASDTATLVLILRSGVDIAAKSVV